MRWNSARTGFKRSHELSTVCWENVWHGTIQDCIGHTFKISNNSVDLVTSLKECIWLLILVNGGFPNWFIVMFPLHLLKLCCILCLIFNGVSCRVLQNDTKDLFICIDSFGSLLLWFLSSFSFWKSFPSQTRTRCTFFTIEQEVHVNSMMLPILWR